MCLLSTWPYANVGRPFLSLTAADATAMAALGTIGFTAGRVLPWRLLAPVLGLATYVVMALPVYAGDSPLRWLSPNEGHYGQWEQPLWWAGPAHMVWTGGVAATLLLLLAARRRVVAVVPLAAALAAAALLVQTGEGIWRPNEQLSARVCREGSPQVCVPHAHRTLLPHIAVEAAAVRGKLAGVPGVPDRFVTRPFADTTEKPPPAGTADLPLLPVNADPKRLEDPDTYRGRVAAMLARPFCGDLRGGPGWPETSEAVVQWLAGLPDPTITYHGGRPPKIDETADRLAAMPEGERREWLTGYFAAVADCAPERVTAP